MSDYQISNVDPNQELAEQGADNFLLIAAIGLGLTTIGLALQKISKRHRSYRWHLYVL